MDENKFIEAVVKAISGLEDTFRSELSGLRSDVDTLRSELIGLRSNMDAFQSELSGLRSDLTSGMERNIGVQNQNTMTVVTMLTSINNQLAAIRNDIKEHADHEDRIKKLEEIVLRKGA